MKRIPTAAAIAAVAGLTACTPKPRARHSFGDRVGVDRNRPGIVVRRFIVRGSRGRWREEWL